MFFFFTEVNQLEEDYDSAPTLIAENEESEVCI